MYELIKYKIIKKEERRVTAARRNRIMNKAMLTGRLTKDPDVRYSQGENQMCISRFTLAVDRRRTKNQDDNAQTADFISCVAFGKTGEFVEKYAKKGMKFDIVGRIQTGSYQNKDGQTVYTTEVVVEDMEFGESKGASSGSGASAASGSKASVKKESAPSNNGFVNLTDDDVLPFN